MGEGTSTATATAGVALEIREACPADMLRVMGLVNRYAARGLMLPRLPEQLVRHFREFVVAVDEEGRLLGCAALRLYTAQLGEVVALAVDEEVQGLGVGRALVERVERDAAALGVGTLFALTLRDRFFHRLGYRTVPKELFPEKVWSDCRACPTRERCMEIAVVKEELPL